MYKIGDYVVYKRDVCIIKAIKENHFMNRDYYVMYPVDDKTLTIDVPTDNPNLRSVISKDKALELIDKIYIIEPLDVNNKNLENEYKLLLQNDNLEDLVKIIKTTYVRNEERKKAGKKIGEKDDNFFKKAERILYNELSVSLNMSLDETKKYIISKVNEMVLK